MRVRRNLAIISMSALVLLIALGANGPCDPIPPPYDVTGDYEGEWWSGEGEHCPLTAMMAMDPAPAFPYLWYPTATFLIDFSCIELPEYLPPLEPIAIDAAGVLDDKGNLTFASGGCGTPFCVLFATAGQGADLDEDGMMDAYAGAWSLTILLAGFEPFGVAGEFELEAAPGEPEALSFAAVE